MNELLFDLDVFSHIKKKNKINNQKEYEQFFNIKVVCEFD